MPVYIFRRLNFCHSIISLRGTLPNVFGAPKVHRAKIKKIILRCYAEEAILIMSAQSRAYCKTFASNAARGAYSAPQFSELASSPTALSPFGLDLRLCTFTSDSSSFSLIIWVWIQQGLLTLTAQLSACET